jgi:DNA-binding Lrp family transcriptional regulator
MTRAETRRAITKCYKFCQVAKGRETAVIADHLGLHVRTCQRLVRRLEREGRIMVARRGERRTVFYVARGY